MSRPTTPIPAPGLPTSEPPPSTADCQRQPISPLRRQAGDARSSFLEAYGRAGGWRRLPPCGADGSPTPQHLGAPASRAKAPRQPRALPHASGLLRDLASNIQVVVVAPLGAIVDVVEVLGVHRVEWPEVALQVGLRGILVRREASIAIERAVGQAVWNRKLCVVRLLEIVHRPAHHIVEDVAGAGDTDDLVHLFAVAVADPHAE